METNGAIVGPVRRGEFGRRGHLFPLRRLAVGYIYILHKLQNISHSILMDNDETY